MIEQPPELRALAELLPPMLRAAVESTTIARFELARMMGRSFNGRRDVYGVLGYDEDITTDQYRDLYKRGGIAGRALDAVAKAVWRGDGELVEDENPETETAFETEWYALNDRLKVWSTMQRLHILASLGSFSVLLLGAPGDWTQELPKATGPKDLKYIQPFGGGVQNESRGQRSSQAMTFGSDVSVDSYDENVKSPRFGQPIAYMLRRTDITSPELTRPVHWTRVIHVPSEGFLDDAVFGPPALEGVWNYFQDLYKVVGGGAETSWLAGYPGMHLDMDKDMEWSSPTDRDAQIEAMKVKAEEYKHQLTRWLQTRGVDVKMLQGKPIDFSANAKTLLSLIAGTRGIPQRILTGSERGELASTQDKQNWDDIVDDCRTSYAHPIILRPFIERLIDYNYMPKPKQWEPAWPQTSGMSTTEKLQGAETMAKLNDHGEIVVTGNEVREFLDMEPLTDEELDAIREQRKEDMPAPTAPAAKTDEQVQKLEAALKRYGSITLAVQA